MESSHLVTLAVIAFCVLMSAYFSATETAYSSLSRVRMKNMASDGNKRAALVLRQSENYDKLISTILIGNNIVNILATSLATVFFMQLFPATGATISTVVMTLVILIFGEISPKSIAKDVKEGKIDIEDISEEVVSNNLYTKDEPDPDLMIRTSGELRLSNFLPWQLVYSEFLFIDKNWPDFTEEDLDNAIIEYQKRTRKFGAN